MKVIWVPEDRLYEVKLGPKRWYSLHHTDAGEWIITSNADRNVSPTGKLGLSLVKAVEDFRKNGGKEPVKPLKAARVAKPTTTKRFTFTGTVKLRGAIFHIVARTEEEAKEKARDGDYVDLDVSVAEESDWDIDPATCESND